MVGSTCGVYAFSWLFVRLVGSYWNFYELGSAGPDGAALQYVYVPGSLLGCSAVTFIIWCLCGWGRSGAWTAMLLSLGAMLVLLSGAFACQVWFTTGDATEAQPGIGAFLQAFFHTLFVG